MDFNKAMDFRHACKIFDETKKIPEDVVMQILESGRKSPSSFGMEPWKFLVITNDALKAKLRPLCWDQVQITSCSHLIVVLAAIDSVRIESGVVKSRFLRRNMPQEKLDFYMSLYASHLAKTLQSSENIYSWTARQTYIASANMMTCAAYLGVDSCAIEGFEKEAVEKLLKLDTKQYQLSLIIPFGYRIKEQPSQVRLSFDEVVEWIK